MVRRAVAAAAVAALAACGTASAYLLDGPAGVRAGTRAAASAPTVGAGALLFTGHGWGHGVGMSQWGAYGYAKRGWTYDRILAHYYPGTVLGPAPVRSLRVLLADTPKAVTISSELPWKVVDASGKARSLVAGELVLGMGLKPRLPAAVKPTQLVQPISFRPGKAPLQLNGKPYRGTLQAVVSKGRLQVVNVLALESYLKGVVPSEMPFSWAPEALKAQAVAARSYALAHRGPGGVFDVYSDVRSQVYLGLGVEKPSSNTAVDGTKGQVVLFDGAIADTLFFSSSGGRTAAAGEVFQGASFPPYLVSVPDPYDASPYRDWGPTAVDVAKAARGLGLKGRVADLRLELWPSGRVRRASLTGSTGTTVTVSGSQLRAKLGLRSTWLGAGLLTLSRPYGPVTYGGAVTVSGLVRDAGTATLEQRTGTPFWQPGQPIEPDASGAFTFVAKPTATTYYRLAAGTVRAPALAVTVAPLVRLAQPQDTVTLRGITKPVVPGGTVQIQSLQGTLWVNVAEAPVDAQGAFAAALGSLRGIYRARYAPGNGLVAGLSNEIQVPS